MSDTINSAIQPLRIKQILGEAWQDCREHRWTFFFAMLIYSTALILITLLFNWDINFNKLVPFLPMNMPELPSWWRKSLPYLAILLVQMPLLAGFWKISVNAATQQSVNLKQLFCYFTFGSIAKFLGLLICYFLFFFPLFILALLCMIHPYFIAHPYLQIIGITFIGLFCIYLLVGYLFGLPLIVLRNMLPHKALKLSRLTINKYWFRVAASVLLTGIVISVGSSLSKLIFLGLYILHIPLLAILAFIFLCLVTYYLTAWYWLVLGVLYRTLLITHTP